MRLSGDFFSALFRLTITKLLVLSFNILLGCGSEQVRNSSNSEALHQDCCTKPSGPENLVDCLLPGQHRKLGSQPIYLIARRPVKTSAQDCEVRGGEYVAYEQATQASALRVWLPQAQSGDAEAQRIVGKIYEQGIDKPVSLVLAAEWYRKAAAQGDAEALEYLSQINTEEATVPLEKPTTSARHKHPYHRTSSIKLRNIQDETLPEPKPIKLIEKTQPVELPEPIQSFQARIEDYLATLKQASYAFNPPSPILVAQPTIVYLLIDPQRGADALVGKLKGLNPKNAERIDSGETKWAHVMEASLSGSDFEVDPAAPVRKTLSPTETAKWSWVVTPKHPGKNLPLSLTANAILPSNLAPPYEVVLLHKEIDVEVTLWWLFDHYFDKYWKWLLGGLAGLMSGVFGWWWKKDRAANSSRKRTPFKIKSRMNENS